MAVYFGHKCMVWEELGNNTRLFILLLIQLLGSLIAYFCPSFKITLLYLLWLLELLHGLLHLRYLFFFFSKYFVVHYISFTCAFLKMLMACCFSRVCGIFWICSLHHCISHLFGLSCKFTRIGKSICYWEFCRGEIEVHHSSDGAVHWESCKGEKEVQLLSDRQVLHWLQPRCLFIGSKTMATNLPATEEPAEGKEDSTTDYNLDAYTLAARLLDSPAAYTHRAAKKK